MSKTVRAIHDALGEQAESCYPEQLDVTFDFVPRMCERQMCAVCPFGKGVARLCHRQRGLLCPVPLVACGYEAVCDPQNCAFERDEVRGLCQRASGL